MYVADIAWKIFWKIKMKMNKYEGRNVNCFMPGQTSEQNQLKSQHRLQLLPVTDNT